MRILGISGSLRTGSSNTALLTVAQAVVPETIEVVIYPSLGNIPHFNPDLDAEGAVAPFAVSHFRDALAQAHALLISTPEYAHGIPGVLKNALDWLVSDTQFVGKPIGIISGSAGSGSYAQAALIEVLNTMSAKVIPGAVISISSVRAKLMDHETEEAVRNVVLALAREIYDGKVGACSSPGREAPL
jgi:NAD(P)H-dependent FMN reductase